MEDASSLYTIYLHLEITKHTGETPFSSINEASAYIKKQIRSSQENGLHKWAITIKETNKCIGWCGFEYIQDEFVNLGFRIAPEYWNRGIASEASSKCLTYLFNNSTITEVVARSTKENKASIKVIEKLGFSFWKHDVCNHDKNACYYKITKEAFVNT